jgi:hypothetical protein
VTPQPHVAVAYLHPGEVSAAFSMSLLKLMLHETFRAGFPPLVIANRCASGNIVAGRNEVAQQFLDGTSVEWLLFVDSDMGFAPDSVEKLIASAHPKDRPVVGGLCFAVKRTGTDPDTHAERFACAPTVYVWREFEDRAGFQVVEDYERDAMVLTSATGAAFVLIHRTVLEAIREAYGDHWFDRIPHEKPRPHGTLFSEDMSFSIRVAGVDCPMYVNTAVKTCHDKGGMFFDEQAWDRQQALVAPVSTAAA